MLSNAFLRSIIDLYFFKKIFFFTTCNGESSRLEEDEKIENNIKNLFRLKKEINDTAIKETRNLFRLKKKWSNQRYSNWNIRNLFENYKPVRVDNFQNSNYIEYEIGSDRNKTQSVEEYFHKIRISYRRSFSIFSF